MPATSQSEAMFENGSNRLCWDIHVQMLFDM